MDIVYNYALLLSKLLIKVKSRNVSNLLYNILPRIRMMSKLVSQPPVKFRQDWFHLKFSEARIFIEVQLQYCHFLVLHIIFTKWIWWIFQIKQRQQYNLYAALYFTCKTVRHFHYGYEKYVMISFVLFKVYGKHEWCLFQC